MKEKRQCAAESWDGLHHYPCLVSAKHQEVERLGFGETGDLLWWCHHHRPSRQDEKDAQWKREQDAEDALLTAKNEVTRLIEEILDVIKQNTWTDRAELWVRAQQLIAAEATRDEAAERLSEVTGK